MEFNEVIDKRKTSREWTDQDVDRVSLCHHSAV